MMSEKTRAEYWANLAWCKISLGNIARPANADAVTREMAPYFAQAMAEARAEAIEECAKVCDHLASEVYEGSGKWAAWQEAADRLRALKERAK